MKIREAELAKAKDKAASLIASVQEEIEKQYNEFSKKLAEERSALKKSIESNLPEYQQKIMSKLKQIS